MKLLKVGEWRAWIDWECAAFETQWPSETTERRAYALALYTGQRKSDLVLMTRAHRKRLHSRRPGQDRRGALDTGTPRADDRTRRQRAYEPADNIAGVRLSMRCTSVRGSRMQSARLAYHMTVYCTGFERRPHANLPRQEQPK